MASRMINAIDRHKVDGFPTAFSLPLDASKVAEVLSVSTGFKAIMGGAFPNHNISTENLNKEDIQAILDQTKDAPVKLEKAHEVKVAFMVFQQVKDGMSPVEIIGACPQSNNESSAFTEDILGAAKTAVIDAVESGGGQVALLNFAVDGVSCEREDVMSSISKFLDGVEDHTGAVDNKHNVKNDRYHVAGGSCAPTIGELVVDSDLLRQAEVPEELLKWKDFSSDKLAEDFFSFKTLKKLVDGIESGLVDGLSGDAGALACTLFFMRLHLHAVNGLGVPARHRALYLWLSMIWFTTLSGVDITPKRNIVSETISNVFLALRSDVIKLHSCTSEPAEHGFGNIRKIFREFDCADFCSLSDREQIRLNQMFAGNLKAAKEIHGYGATFEDYIEALKAQGLEGGPCMINYSDNAAPVAEQLWPHVKKIIDQAERMIVPLLRLIGVDQGEMSPFCKSFETTKELLRAYISYCPKTFSYKGQSGEMEGNAGTMALKLTAVRGKERREML